MTMADMMYSHSPLCPEDCECIAIAHCNFGLRPGDCDADEVLVRKWAEQRGIPFRSIHFDTLGYAREHRCGIEVAAREQRYRWFAELCEELGCDGVATAHHADDNLETLLLNLLRGTGLKGICGMCGTDRLPYQREDGKLLLIRPLLRLSREDIREYALSHGVPWREDLSNGEDCYRRNFLRNRVIPLLRELNPSLSTVIADDMENFRIAELALADWERKEKERLIVGENGRETLPLAALRSCASPVQLLWSWLSGKGFSRDNILKINALAQEGRASGQIFRSAGKSPVKEGYCLHLSSCGLQLVPEEALPLELECSLEEYDGSPVGRPEAGTLLLNADSLGYYELRRWKDGDWFIPFGMKGSKKLSDWFTDIKATPADKEEAIVVAAKTSDGENPGSTQAAGERIAAVLCRKACRQDESTRIGPGCRNTLKISIKEDR